MTISAMNETADSPKMKDFTRPTLCVIDENGIAVTEDESEIPNDKDFIRPTLCVINENGIAVTDDEQEISNEKDFTRPTLCVIDENGIQITEDEIEILGDENHNRKTSLTDVFHPDLSDRLSFVQNHIASIDNSRNRSPTLRRKIPVRDHNSNVTSCEDTDLGETDLSELKATATRLNLRTRRQSYVTWKDQYIDHKSSVKPSLGKVNTDQTVTENRTDKPDDEFTEERKNRINEALGWLRNELQNVYAMEVEEENFRQLQQKQEMRLQDQVLARQLLSLRHEIHQLKLQRSCEEHQEMLEDVTMDIAETHELQEICDIPLSDSMNGTPLKHLGVTRMHLSARRFSTC